MIPLSSPSLDPLSRPRGAPRPRRTGLALTPAPSVRTEDERADDVRVVAQGRGLVLYVGLSESRAHAVGTSLERIAFALRAQVSALLPEAEAEVRLVTSRGDDSMSDLDAVRHARGTGGGRATGPTPSAPSTTGVEIDLRRQSVHVDGRPVALSEQQSALLRLLVGSPGITLDRPALAASLGCRPPGPTAPASAHRWVDVLVRRLRARLEPYGGTVVRTVRGTGYRFDPHPDVRVRGAHHPAPAPAPAPTTALTPTQPDAVASARQRWAATGRQVNDVC